jgi:hypothetical protein
MKKRGGIAATTPGNDRYSKVGKDRRYKVSEENYGGEVPTNQKGKVSFWTGRVDSQVMAVNCQTALQTKNQV